MEKKQFLTAINFYSKILHLLIFSINLNHTGKQIKIKCTCSLPIPCIIFVVDELLVCQKTVPFRKLFEHETWLLFDKHPFQYILLAPVPRAGNTIQLAKILQGRLGHLLAIGGI